MKIIKEKLFENFITNFMVVRNWSHEGMGSSTKISRSIITKISSGTRKATCNQVHGICNCEYATAKEKKEGTEAGFSEKNCFYYKELTIFFTEGITPQLLMNVELLYKFSTEKQLVINEQILKILVKEQLLK